MRANNELALDTDISLDPKHRKHCYICKLKHTTRTVVKHAISNFYFNLDNSQEKEKFRIGHHLDLKGYELSLFGEKARLDNIFGWHEIFKKYPEDESEGSVEFWSRAFQKEASTEIEYLINIDIKNHLGDKVHMIEIDNWTALKLYLERRINLDNLKTAQVDFYTRTITIHPVYFKTIHGIFPYSVIVKPSKQKKEPWVSYEIRTLDHKGNVIK